MQVCLATNVYCYKEERKTKDDKKQHITGKLIKKLNGQDTYTL